MRVYSHEANDYSKSGSGLCTHSQQFLPIIHIKFRHNAYISTLTACASCFYKEKMYICLMVHIGIDPAFRKNGFAICIIDECNEVAFHTFKDFLAFIKWSFSDDAPKDAIVIVENANMQDLTFNMSGSKGEIAKRSRNVGTNQAISQATVDLCRYVWGIGNVIEVSPKEKGAKWTAKEANFFAKAHKHILNLKGIDAEQDKRDAYKLCLMAITKLVTKPR